MFCPGQFIALAAAFTCLIFATSSASTAGWLSAQVLVFVALFVVFIGLFAKLSTSSCPFPRRFNAFELSAAFPRDLKAKANRRKWKDSQKLIVLVLEDTSESMDVLKQRHCSS